MKGSSGVCEGLQISMRVCVAAVHHSERGNVCVHKWSLWAYEEQSDSAASV